MTPFDSNTDIWMKELTKKIISDIINKGIPVDMPETTALTDTISV